MPANVAELNEVLHIAKNDWAFAKIDIISIHTNPRTGFSDNHFNTIDIESVRFEDIELENGRLKIPYWSGKSVCHHIFDDNNDKINYAIIYV